MKKVINTAHAPAPIGPYNQAILAQGMLYCSGQIAIHPETGELETDTIQQETHRVLQNLGAVLKEAGASYADVVKCSIFLSDMAYFGEVNTIYAEYFTNLPPARETVAVATLPKNVNVEISCIAVVAEK